MKKRMTIRMNENLHKKIEQLTNERGISMNAVVVEACWQLVENMRHLLDQENDERKEP